MLRNLRNKVSVGAVSVGLVLACSQTICSQTSSAQSITIRSQQELALALLKAQTERPADVPSLLKANAQFLSETFWQEILDAAAQRYSQNQQDRAFLLYAIARQVAAELKSQKLLAKTYYYLGRSYSGLNQFDKAKAAYLESKKAFTAAGLERDLIYILSDLGILCFIQEDYAAARSYSEESVKLADSVKGSVAPQGAWPDEFGVAGALSTLGELAAREGDISQALDYLQRSLTLYQRLSNAESSYDYYLADVHASLGRVYMSAGDNVQALAVLNKALVISKALKNQQQEASRLNDIGYLYMEQEDYAQARAKFKESLSIYRLLKNQREESRVLLNLGVIEQREARFDEALVHFHSSLETAKATDTFDVRIAAGEGIGVALTGKKDFVAALKVLDESLAFASKINDRTREAEVLWRSAEVRYEMGDFASSLQLAQKALDQARQVHSPKLVYLVTATIGQTYAALNKNELAIQTLKEAVALAEAMRDQVAGQDESQQLFFENKISSYNSLIKLLIEQGNTFDALVYAERAKGRVLLDVLRSGRSDIAKYITRSEKEQTQLLNRKLSEINDRIKIEESAGSSSLISLYRQLDTARLEYQSFQNALYVTHPDMRRRSGRTAPVTTEDINRLALNNCAYLEYVVSKEHVYVFVLTKKSGADVFELKVVTLATKSADLAQKTDLFHQRLADRHPEFADLSRELYKALVEPVVQQLRGFSSICIIPDAFLWNLPFQALMPRTNHYLIEDYALSYATSLSVLLEMTKERVAAERRKAFLIALGNPVIGKDEQRNEKLCPLPEAETEVRSIAKKYGPAAKVLIGREASEKSFKALAPTYTRIHLATHGVLDNRHPLYSHLLLTKTNDDPENDGLLEAREIMNMDLRADLAVLSACETANGRVREGEGVVGMSWAFFVGGTRSILVSQWKVNSASTSQLMMGFYQVLESPNKLSKSKKAEALQGAALKLLKDRQYRHPFYWAGFVLIGDSR
jgi:CHAT domain-containing protein